MTRSFLVACCLALVLAGGPALAHASGQSLALLLPTTLYTAAGTAIVVLSALATVVFPRLAAENLFQPGKPKKHGIPAGAETLSSLACACVFLALVFLGFRGSQDPLGNLLPLTVWTAWWICAPLLCVIFGAVWRFINPWSGPCWLISKAFGRPAILRVSLPRARWPAAVIFVVFSMFLLADPAPDAPRRLAAVAFGYWLFSLVGMALFGARAWAIRFECFTVAFGLFASLSSFCWGRRILRAGFPGWQVVHRRNFSVSAGLMAVAMLGAGSFDGLNETFFWLDLIGVNPLEYPGRSAVIGRVTAGLAASALLLALAFAAAIALGRFLAGGDPSPRPDFPVYFARMALTILPIAAAYHFAHYLTALLVNSQHLLVALSDPFSSGKDYLGLGEHFVTTGFFKTIWSVRVIWLSQAAAVVAGHVLSILLAHGVAMKIYGNARQAIASQLPLMAFMIAYTLFGLWLLASPKVG